MKLSYIVIFFLATVLLFTFLIPAFQNPDEPHHFEAALIVALGEGKRELIENEMIHLMDRNSWWKFVGMGKPDGLPKNLDEIPYLMGYYPSTDYKSRLNNIIFYHFLLGTALKLLSVKNIALAYHFCQCLSAILIAASLCLVFLTFKKILGLGGTGKSMYWGPLLVLLLPQYLILSISVSSDAPSLAMSTVFFFFSFILITKEFKGSHIILFIILLLVAAIGFLIDRSIFSLIFLTALVPLFLVNRKNYREIAVLALGFIIVFMFIGNLLVSFFPLQVENSAEIIKSMGGLGLSGVSKILSASEFNRRFFIFLTDSFLLKFGWMAFDAGKVFYFLWRFFILLSIAGTAIFLAKFFFMKIVHRMKEYKYSAEFKLAIFSLVAVLIQIFGIWGYYGINKILPQGRYLFPVIVPIAFLLVLGLKTFFDIFHRKAGTIALSVFIVLEFLFLNYTIWNYILPVFHLTVKSPHPGI